MHSTFDKLRRIDERDYPEVAIREALLNSLVHRGYSFLASTLISIYSDRIEFTTIGGLVSGVTVNDILLGLCGPMNRAARNRGSRPRTMRSRSPCPICTAWPVRRCRKTTWRLLSCSMSRTVRRSPEEQRRR